MEASIRTKKKDSLGFTSPSAVAECTKDSVVINLLNLTVSYSQQGNRFDLNSKSSLLMVGI